MLLIPFALVAEYLIFWMYKDYNVQPSAMELCLDMFGARSFYEAQSLNSINLHELIWQL